MEKDAIYTVSLPLTQGVEYLNTIKGNVNKLDVKIDKDFGTVHIDIIYTDGGKEEISNLEMLINFHVIEIKKAINELEFAKGQQSVQEIIADDADYIVIEEPLPLHEPKSIKFFDTLLEKLDELDKLMEPELKKRVEDLENKANDITFEPSESILSDNNIKVIAKQIKQFSNRFMEILESDESTPAAVQSNEVEPTPLGDPDRSTDPYGATEMKKVLSEMYDIDENTYMNNLVKKVHDYNIKVSEFQVHRKELDEYLSLLPNKEKYNIVTNKDGSIEIVKIPEIVMVNYVGFFADDRGEFKSYFKNSDGVYSEVDIREHKVEFDNLKNYFFTDTIIKFNKFTLTHSGKNTFAVELVEDVEIPSNIVLYFNK